MHFNYQFEYEAPDGSITVFTEKNLIPTEGLNHMLSVVVAGGVKVSTWYVGIYEGDYTPIATNTAANFPGLATECTAYAEASRPTFVEGSVSAGAVDNSASKAEFTMNATKTVYGCFLVSTATKGATTGTLLSAVRFSTPQDMTAGGFPRVSAPLSLTGA